MPLPPSDPGADPDSKASLTQRLGQLTSENATLQAQLHHSETARADLMAQMEHIIAVLGDSRRQLNALWQQQGQAPRS